MSITQPDTPQDFAALHAGSAPLVALPVSMADYVLGSMAADGVAAPFDWDLSKAPLNFSLRPFEDEVRAQLYQDCVGNGTDNAIELFQALRAEGQNKYAALFVYWIAREALALATSTPMSDTGVAISTAYHELRHKGICREVFHPYGMGPASRPSADAYADAATRLVGRYERCGRNTFNMLTGESIVRDMEADLKVALLAGCPVNFGVPLSWDFYGLSGPMETHPEQWSPPPLGQGPGSHCMTVIGWRTRAADGVTVFEVENSWGATFGDGGFIGMTARQLADHAFDVLCPREIDGVRSAIAWSYYKWRGDATLGDGTRVSVNVNGVPGQVFRLYRAALGRLPDKAGLGYQIDDTGRIGLLAVAANFIASPEFQSSYGSLGDVAFVTRLYQNVLQREPEAGGLAYHVGNLAAGMPRAQVLVGFSESPENKGNTRSDFGHGIAFTQKMP